MVSRIGSVRIRARVRRALVHRGMAVRFGEKAHGREEWHGAGRADQSHQPPIGTSVERSPHQRSADSSSSAVGMDDHIPQAGMERPIVEQPRHTDQFPVGVAGREPRAASRERLQPPRFALGPLGPGVRRVHLGRRQRCIGLDPDLDAATQRRVIDAARSGCSPSSTARCTPDAAVRSSTPEPTSSPATARSTPAGGRSRSSS